MTDNQILAGAERQAQLEAAKAAFFASGGSIAVIAGCSFTHPPMRFHPQPSVKPKQFDRAEPKLRPSQSAIVQRNDRIAELAETMTCNQAAEAMGISPKSIRDIARGLGIKFVPAPTGRAPRPKSEFTAMANRVEAMSKIGVSRTMAAKHLGISHQSLLGSSRNSASTSHRGGMQRNDPGIPPTRRHQGSEVRSPNGGGHWESLGCLPQLQNHSHCDAKRWLKERSA